MQRSWRYKLSVVDSCDVESDLSDNHKTMHLTINLGINNSINLIWDHYEGFDFETYYIHRRSDSGWELLDSVPNNLTSYTDANPILDEYLYYMIEIKHPYGCNPTKASRNTSRSNVSSGKKAESSGSDTTSIMILDNHIKRFDIYPNPNDGSFIIQIETSIKQDFWYSIYNINGQLIENKFIGNLYGKNEKPINLSRIENGIYFVKLESNSGTIIKKIIINK